MASGRRPPRDSPENASPRWAELEEKEEFRKRCYEVEKEEQQENLQEKSDLSFDPVVHVAGNTKAAAGNPQPATDRTRPQRTRGREEMNNRNEEAFCTNTIEGVCGCGEKVKKW